MKYFRKLNRKQQLTLLAGFGVLLMECQRLKFSIFLFELHDFYVEVFSVPGSEEVIMINTFSDTESLEPYLDEIDISELMVQI